MKALFWTPPWIANGDPLFYRNALRNHLIPQANVLSGLGWDVDVVFPPLLADEARALHHGANGVHLSLAHQFELCGTVQDPSTALYLETDADFIERLCIQLAPVLGDKYDVVLVWETPIPFLERMFPNALIIHQMPGAFARAPHPATVTFDPQGLYRKGTLFRNAATISSERDEESLALGREFSRIARSRIEALQPLSRRYLDPEESFEKLTLIPLQVSEHYAFQADTKYRTQMDFLLDALRRTPQDVGLVATQYVTPRVADTVLNAETHAALRKAWPNLIYRPEFDRMSSVSQYMLPLVDAIVSCSSSIAFQGMMYNRKIHIFQETFLAPFDSERDALSEEDRRDRSERVLGFSLSRLQPLGSDVLRNPEFLCHLLEEMVGRKRRGLQGLDLLPTFRSIDSDYPQRLLDSFRVKEAARDLGRKSIGWIPGQSELGEVHQLLTTPGLEAVSFDVFDTLINRPVAVPANAFNFLESYALELTGGRAQNFPQVRLDAEIRLRHENEGGEIKLEDIYARISEVFELSVEVEQRLLQAEIELELQLCEARPLGKRLWSLARATGRPIYLISDMYLPKETVEKMLEKAGYGGQYERLFLSRDYGVRKREGGLFDIFLAEVGGAPQKILHIGDHKVSDWEQAKSRQISAYRIPNAIDRLRGNSKYREIFKRGSVPGERAPAVLASLVAHKLFDAPSGPLERETLFRGDPYLLGYAGLGPVIAGYCIWLLRQASRDKVSRLYFLSREGWVLKQAYDVLSQSFGETPRSEYLYSSRRAARVAGLRTAGDVVALSGHPYADGVPLGSLLSDRFGLAPQQVSGDALRVCGFERLDMPLSRDAVIAASFGRLCRNLADPILAGAAQERDCYLEYLHTTGIFAEEHPAVVDVGWRSNIQGAIGGLVGRTMSGYYYATLQGAEQWTSQGHLVWGYAGSMASPTSHPSILVRERKLAEYLLCHRERSLVCFDRTDGSLRPRFRFEAGAEVRRNFIADVHLGAIQFSRDLGARLGPQLEELWIDPFLAEGTLASFFTQPHPEDAAMLVGHQMEDALGGVSSEFIIERGGGFSRSLWKAGASAAAKRASNQQSGLPLESTVSVSKFTPSSGSPFQKLAIRAERTVVPKLVSDRKRKKYERDREKFFSDSRNSLATAWFRITKSARSGSEGQ